VGAFSLRKLRAAQTSCIVGRRASNSDELAIGFSGNVMDATALTTFGSGTNVDIKTWANQIGSNDVSQSIAGKQPRIVTSGAIETDGADYGVKFIKADADVLTGNLLTTSKVYTVFAVVKFATSGSQFSPILLNGDAYANGYGIYTEPNGGNPSRYVAFSGSIGSKTLGDISTNTQLLTVKRASDTDLQAWINGTLVYSGSANIMNTPSGTFYLGGGNFGEFFGGHILELIVYDSDQSANRTAIEDNISNFYTNL
jgi:hypothetical protein